MCCTPSQYGLPTPRFPYVIRIWEVDMRVPHRLLFPLTLLLIFLPFSRTIGDDHIVIERARAGMGIQFPPAVSEIWLNETSVCTKGSRLTTIERYDLGKRWRLSARTKRYF